MGVSAFLLFEMWFMLLVSAGSFLERHNFRLNWNRVFIFKRSPSGSYAQWSLRRTRLKHTGYSTVYKVLVGAVNFGCTFKLLRQPNSRPIKSDYFGVGTEYCHFKKAPLCTGRWWVLHMDMGMLFYWLEFWKIWPLIWYYLMYLLVIWKGKYKIYWLHLPMIRYYTKLPYDILKPIRTKCQGTVTRGGWKCGQIWVQLHLRVPIFHYIRIVSRGQHEGQVNNDSAVGNHDWKDREKSERVKYKEQETMM